MPACHHEGLLPIEDLRVVPPLTGAQHSVAYQQGMGHGRYLNPGERPPQRPTGARIINLVLFQGIRDDAGNLGSMHFHHAV